MVLCHKFCIYVLYLYLCTVKTQVLDRAATNRTPCFAMIVPTHTPATSNDTAVIAREWIVEQFTPTGARCIGKAIPAKPTLFLNNDDLEVIWDLANWGASQPYEFIPKCDTYKTCRCFHWDGKWGYVDMGKTSCCNGDIFVRRHYDTEEGFFIVEDRVNHTDEWVYGTREEWMNYMKTTRYAL